MRADISHLFQSALAAARQSGAAGTANTELVAQYQSASQALLSCVRSPRRQRVVQGALWAYRDAAAREYPSEIAQLEVENARRALEGIS